MLYLPFLQAHLAQSRTITSVDHVLPQFSIDDRSNQVMDANIEAIIRIMDELDSPSDSTPVMSPAARKDLFISLQQHLMTWELSKTLWGTLPLRVNGAYPERVLRRHQLSRWLEHAVLAQYRAAKDLVSSTKFPAPDGALHEILVALSALRIEDAVGHALSINENELAMMLTQVTSPTNIRNIAKQQLKAWHSRGLDKSMNPLLLVIVRLICGDVDPATSIATGMMDWKRAFAHHLWFATAPNAPISEALKSFNSAVIRRRAALPKPAYLEGSKPQAGLMEEAITDVLYQLLCLYCDSNQSLLPALLPDASLGFALDYRYSTTLIIIVFLIPHTKL
jgi:nuclear pore complex protein Nup98-Nup96